MEDTSRYLQCMQEVRERLKLIELVTEKKLTTGREFSDVEFVFLQLRKILQLIAFASLTANREKYSAVHAKFASHWKAKDMLAALEKINPDFYPSPSTPPVLQPDETKYLDTIKEGFLTKDDFKFLYDKCAEILHARNPFTDKSLTVDVLYPVTLWVSRIHKLLDLHVMHLLDGKKWVVEIPKEGNIHLWPAKVYTSWPAKKRK